MTAKLILEYGLQAWWCHDVFICLSHGQWYPYPELFEGEYSFVRTDYFRIAYTVSLQWGRKERFVLAASLAFGVGNLLAPGWFEHLFDGVTSTSKGLNGFLSSITIILSAPCKHSWPNAYLWWRADNSASLDLAAFLVGCILWNIIPDDPETIVRYSADQGALEMGQMDQADAPMPSMGYRSSGKATSEQEDEDFKAIGASTRVEPVA